MRIAATLFASTIGAALTVAALCVFLCVHWIVAADCRGLA